MNYCVVNPPPELAGYVRFYWALEAVHGDGDFHIYRTMANGYPSLLFHYQGHCHELKVNESNQTLSLSGFHGQTGKCRKFKIDKTFGIFGVCLYPFALPCLFNIPASEITDQTPELISVLGAEAKNLEEQVMLSESTEARVKIISAFLRSKLNKKRKKDDPVYKAITTVMNLKGQVNILQLAGDSFLSRRQFERRFKELSGFSPKTYSNIIRFQSIFDELTIQQPAALTQVAYDCGYYDQSHFIHDFKRFSGFNPRQFLIKDSSNDTLWPHFVAFFQFLSYCPPVLCRRLELK